MSEELFPEFPVLVVDDEKDFLNSVYMSLRTDGIANVERCHDSLEVMPRLSKNKYSVILLDLVMPGISGQELLPKIVDDYPDTPVVIVTALTDINTTIECMRNGAFDYLVKPVNMEDLIKAIRAALNRKEEHKKEVTLMKQKLALGIPAEQGDFPNIVTQSDKMKDIFHDIGLISITSKPVLIIGETGVGKELVARAIHEQSKRKGKFIPVNTAGVDDTLFADTLFGHKKGAFADAYEDRDGQLKKAKGGTIFLDEIGDLSGTSQVKLLRLIQEREYLPLGADDPIVTDAKIVVATNKDLTSLIKSGKFREDLYYRLSIHEIFIPPLRERSEDIPLLVKHFLKKAAADIGKQTPAVPKELFTLLENYDFPGNVRELESMVFDAVSRHQSGILPLDVFWEKTKNSAPPTMPPPVTSSRKTAGPTDAPTDKKVIFGKTLPTFDQLETIYMKEVMERAKGNKSVAARLAGLNRKTFAYRLSRLNKNQDKANR